MEALDVLPDIKSNRKQFHFSHFSFEQFSPCRYDFLFSAFSDGNDSFAPSTPTFSFMLLLFFHVIFQIQLP